MLLAFLERLDIVHYEFALKVIQTIKSLSQHFKVLKCLQDVVQRMWPEMWTAGCRLLHDNAPAHISLSIKQFLAKYSIPTLQQCPYSPDLSPPDLFIFPKVRTTLKERRFQTVEDVINATNDLKAIPQISFNQCFQNWKNRWERCIAVQEVF